MVDVRRARKGAALMGASLALAGCAADVGSSEPAPGPTTTTMTTESVEKAPVSEAAQRTTDDAHRCSPEECCFPSVGGGWQDNALEDDLRALGCTTPSPYALTGNEFWVSTQCPFDLGVIGAVFRYAGTPYDAHFVENACLGFRPGTVNVVFDPTCSTCIIQAEAAANAPR
jgi:hypothetical protein